MGLTDWINNLYQKSARFSILKLRSIRLITVVTHTIIIPVEAVRLLHLSRCYRYQPWRIPPHPALPRCSGREPAGPAAGYTPAEAQEAKAEDCLHPQCSKK
jgi:hypothetical protein